MSRDKKKRRRQPGTRKKKHYILRFLIFIAVLVGLYFLAMSEFFAINDISVAGEKHFSSADILEMSSIKDGMNIFKTSMSKAEKRIEQDPYIESAIIKRKLPASIEITVKERTEDYCLKYEGKYYILAGDGMALRVSEAPAELTVIENLKIDKLEVGCILETSQKQLLKKTLDFISKAEAEELPFTRVQISESVAKAYINDTFLCKGNISVLTDEMGEMKKILLDLVSKDIERGTVIINSNGTGTFTPEVE